MRTAMRRNSGNKEFAMVHNLFSSRIRNMRYIPGRESFDERQEKIREHAEFQAIDDYCEQA